MKHKMISPEGLVVNCICASCEHRSRGTEDFGRDCNITHSKIFGNGWCEHYEMAEFFASKGYTPVDTGSEQQTETDTNEPTR